MLISTHTRPRESRGTERAFAWASSLLDACEHHHHRLLAGLRRVGRGAAAVGTGLVRGESQLVAFKEVTHRVVFSAGGLYPLTVTVESFEVRHIQVLDLRVKLHGRGRFL